jgi:sugar O-acyltransferase (sialic acid O-acetyltransferase NeuD family)
LSLQLPQRLVLYGIGSPLAIDAEEACARAGIAIVAGVRNIQGAAYVTAAVPVVERAAVRDEQRSCGFIVPMFTPGHRRAAVEDARSAGFVRGATLVDPTSAVARSVHAGEGLFVNAGCVVGGACELGDWVLINRSASIGHHVRIGDFASIGPGAILCGTATIGRGTMIGAGSVVLPGVTIGSHCVVAAGSLVREPVADNTAVDGHPARVRQTGIAGYKGLSV